MSQVVQLPPEFMAQLFTQNYRTITETEYSDVLGIFYQGPHITLVVKRLRIRGDPSACKERVRYAAGEWMRAKPVPHVQELVGVGEQGIFPCLVTRPIGRRLAECPPPSPQKKLIILWKIAATLRSLHAASPPILHTNVRCVNILVDQSFNPSLCDIGVHDAICPPAGVCSSVRWKAPEKLRGAGHTKKCDVWSFGMTCLELMTQQIPFSHLPTDAAVTVSVDSHGIPRRPPPHIMSDELWKLLRACWSSDPEERPPMDFIVAELRSIYTRASVLT